ncbi:hypothetical protein NDU88_008169 [Pleurodeles waltl]|uniref:Uncharacterized protein n=1 Tax=Pleurodeles waltl TaxID=8319 RepID=A0AAV7VV00_PLEWA|nr:hypothetical protein NDU88_008169 [Pleurodeles waltl]
MLLNTSKEKQGKLDRNRMINTSHRRKEDTTDVLERLSCLFFIPIFWPAEDSLIEMSPSSFCGVVRWSKKWVSSRDLQEAGDLQLSGCKQPPKPGSG